MTGRSPDGLVEAIELDRRRPRTRRSSHGSSACSGTRRRPRTTDPAQQSLFDALVLLARLARHAGEARRVARAAAATTASWNRTQHGPTASRSRRLASWRPCRRTSWRASTTSARPRCPDLAAKPTIDIQLSLTAMVPRDAYVEPLRALGYRWVLDPWDVEHEYFCLDVEGERSFQVHVCAAGSTWERRHLVFRDWLRAHPDDAAAYEELKRGARRRPPATTRSATPMPRPRSSPGSSTRRRPRPPARAWVTEPEASTSAKCRAPA